MKRLLLALLFSLVPGASAQMVVSVTETPYSAMLGMYEIAYSWTTNAAGTANGTTAAAYIGEIAGAYTVMSKTSPPVTLGGFDIAVRDSRGVDVLLDAGNTVAVNAFLSADGDGEGYGYGEGLGTVFGSTLTLYVRGAGATKSAVTYVFVRQR